MMPTFDGEGNVDMAFFKGAWESRAKTDPDEGGRGSVLAPSIVYFSCEIACLASAEKGSGKPACKARSNASRA